MSEPEPEDLLVEIGTEELPPGALSSLSEAFRDQLAAQLDAHRIDHGDARAFATPRRLAVLVDAVAPTQRDDVQSRRGPALAAAFNAAGEPTKAALGFARSCGVPVEALEREETDKGSWLSYRHRRAGQDTGTLLPGLIEAALAALPIPKRMRWGVGEAEFVRPVHWVCVLLGSEPLEGADRNCLIVLPTSTHILTRCRTDAAQRESEWDRLLDDADCLVVVLRGDAVDEPRDVTAGGAGKLTRSKAIAAMVREQHLQSKLARQPHDVAVGVHHHAIGDRGGAGGLQASRPLDLHHTHSTGSHVGEVWVMTEGGDVDTGRPGRFEDCAALGSCDPLTIDG